MILITFQIETGKRKGKAIGISCIATVDSRTATKKEKFVGRIMGEAVRTAIECLLQDNGGGNAVQVGEDAIGLVKERLAKVGLKWEGSPISKQTGIK